MARVLIDVSAASDEWLKTAIRNLSNCANVKFLYSDHQKYRKEVAKHSFLGLFLKLMKQKGRREDTDPDVCERMISYLEGLPEWQGEQACDDPHIFAIIFQKPNAYVFTRDSRLVKCQQCMNRVINKRFRSFTTIQSEANFNANADQIRA